MHKCSEECACPQDGKPLLYHPPTDTHACSDPTCVYANGMPWETDSLGFLRDVVGDRLAELELPAGWSA